MEEFREREFKPEAGHGLNLLKVKLNRKSVTPVHRSEKRTTDLRISLKL